MLEKMKELNKKPMLYQISGEGIWNHPHISKQMLKAHLNPNLESATRKMSFVENSVKWITETLPPGQYLRLLDLGCGPGIYAELFTAAGYQVDGIDLSENSVEYARASAQQKGLSINYQTGNYIQAPLPQQVDLITMIYCDFGVLLPADRRQLLKKIRAALAPGGFFLFDVFTPRQYDNRPEFKNWLWENEGFWRDSPYLLLQAMYRYDESNTFLDQYIVIEETQTTNYHLWEHTFTIEELQADLAQAGFGDIEFYGDVTGKAYGADSNTICAVARRG